MGMLDDLDSADVAEEKIYWQPGIYRFAVTDLYEYVSKRTGDDGFMLKGEILEVIEHHDRRTIVAGNETEFQVEASNRVGDKPAKPICGGDKRLNRKDIRAIMEAVVASFPEKARPKTLAEAVDLFVTGPGEETPVAGLQLIAKVAVDDRRVMRRNTAPFPNLTVHAIPAEDQPEGLF